MDNLKTKANDLDVNELKVVCVNLKNLRDVASKRVAKNTISSTLNKKVNN